MIDASPVFKGTKPSFGSFNVKNKNITVTSGFFESKVGKKLYSEVETVFLNLNSLLLKYIVSLLVLLHGKSCFLGSQFSSCLDLYRLLNSST